MFFVIYNLGLQKGSSALKGSEFIEDWFKTSTSDKGHTGDFREPLALEQKRQKCNHGIDNSF